MDRHSITPWKLVIVFIVFFSSQSPAADINFVDKPDNQLTQQINRHMKDFQHYLDSQNYASALSEANKIVMLFDGETHLKNQARTLLNLAKVQQIMGLHLKSEKNYKKSIHIIERQEGIFSSELLTLLYNLGSLYYDIADYELAIETFRRAQHITHRNDGVYSLEQLKFIDSITRVNVKTSKLREADKQQRFYYSINVKNYGEDDPRMLPAMNKMADWFKASGQTREALATYERALAVIDKYELGETKKLQPLRGLSTVIYLKGSCCIDEPLGEALQIVMTDPDSDHVDELDALVHLADMHMIRKKRSVAKKYYQNAWNRLGAENPLTHELFDTPELLGVSRIEDVHKAYYLTVEGRSQMSKTVYRLEGQSAGSLSITSGEKRSKPATPVIGEPLSLCHSQALELARTNDTEDLAQYFVDVNFTVTSEGATRNIALLNSNAPRRLQRYVTNTLRQARYRPTFREGKAVDTNNIKLRQTFSRNSPIQVSQTPFHRASADGRRAVSLGCQLLATS